MDSGINMVFSVPKVGQKSTWSDFSVGSLPFVLQQQLGNRNQPIVVIGNSAEQVLRWQEAWAFFAPEAKTAFLPDWETLPYEHLSPNQDLISERLSVFWQLRQKQLDVLFVPVATAMQKLPPMSFLDGRTFWMQVGDKLNEQAIRAQLIEAGYENVTNVLSTGEFASRGGLLDIFPMGSDTPYRIDLFGDEIDSIKTFDPDTQRTIEEVGEIRLLPAHEFPTDAEHAQLFREQFREHIEGDPSQATVYNAVGKAQYGAGVEYYLPLFYPNGLANLLDYVGQEAICVLADGTFETSRIFWADVKKRYQYASGDPQYPPLPPQHLYLTEDQFGAMLKPHAQILLGASNNHGDIPMVAVNRQQEAPLSALQQFVDGFAGQVLICAESLGRRETMVSFMQQQGMKPVLLDSWQDFLLKKPKLAIVVGNLADGFVDSGQQFAIISEGNLYQNISRPSRRLRRHHAAVTDTALRDLAEINIGDPVVHEEHGIGRFMGLCNLDLGDGDNEMMLLEYAQESQLYVPVSQLHLISRYSGQALDNVALHRLGNATWGKAKRKAAEKARDTAAELLNLYAQRAAQSGFQFAINENDYHDFVAGFGHEETPDQLSAITAVLGDLTQSKPMDRLICGDVGFGKTEVALRAAFVAVMGGKQVAILAPTTLLVEQHAEKFADRFANFPVKVAQLSRFNSTKENKAALAGLADGSVDIVIGTHKLVQPDIVFKNLGLVIIDEEHRFGVRQKEQLKRLRSNVDVMTMTATPIPRTLSMALEGLRDFSLITTAPSRRLAVKTYVKPFAEATIREAMLRELKRGGQVFFLHNEVDTILNMEERLIELMPEARIAVAHGQLRERELEQVMRDFMQQRFNVLLCSTIIETGIDIPNANTIIINRADKFGLAQLHQLRGRVGRSHHQAYAYLLTPDYISKDAEKRLDAIAMADELGAGFTLAMHDLEIRGAGEVLGEGQSGEMLQVGFGLYTEMLKQAVRALKKGFEPDLDAPLAVTTEIKLHSPALLPEAYCPDIHERLVLYKRLATAENNAEVDRIYEELIDRFGLPEITVKTLVESHRLRIQAKALGISSIDASAESIVLTMGKDHNIDPTGIIMLIQQNKQYQLAGPDKLKVVQASTDVTARIGLCKNILQMLKVL